MLAGTTNGTRHFPTLTGVSPSAAAWPVRPGEPDPTASKRPDLSTGPVRSP